MINLIVGIVCAIWVIAMWGVLIYAFRRGWGPYIRSKKQEKIRVEAKVSNKLGREEYNPFEQCVEMVQKILVFQCEDGVTRDYEVRDAVWDWVEKGDDGVLVYQGDLFVDFEARRPRHDMDELYKKLTRH